MESLEDIAADNGVSINPRKSRIELLRAICVKKGLSQETAEKANHCELIRYWAANR